VSIDVFCNGHLDNEGNPTHDRWVVARWKRIDGKWATTKRVSEPGEELRLLKGGSAAQVLDGDDRLNLREDRLTDARTRYRFACPCGVSLVRNKTPEVERRLTEILDAAESVGVPELPLLELTRRFATAPTDTDC
jgi:hypothetical protein